MFRYSLLLVCVLIPAFSFAEASVVINEVAWMGTEESASNEWIELYNNGSSTVDLSGWVLRGSHGENDESPLIIDFSKEVESPSIGPDEYAVLERTDKYTLVSVAELLTYSGSMNNGGMTLSLRKADGVIVDGFDDEDGWKKIGGDNDTKATAQLTSNGWITAVATPGEKNATTPQDVDTVEEDTDSTNKESNDDEREERESGSSENTGSTRSSENTENEPEEKNEHISLTLPDTTLHITLTIPSVGHVGIPISFSAEGTGIGESLIDSLKYQWNFGDTYIGKGKEITHTYTFPGRYIAVLDASYARHHAVAQKEIQILPVALSLTRGKDDTILLANSGSRNIDISGFTLQGEQQIIMPEHTILRANGSLRVSNDRLETGTEKLIALYDLHHQPIAFSIPEMPVTNVRLATPINMRGTRRTSEYAVQPIATARVARSTASDRGVGGPTARTMPDDTASAKEQASESSPGSVQGVEGAPEISKASDGGSKEQESLKASVGDAGTTFFENERLPYLFLVVVILLGLLGIYARRLPWTK